MSLKPEHDFFYQNKSFKIYDKYSIFLSKYLFYNKQAVPQVSWLIYLSKNKLKEQTDLVKKNNEINCW